MPSPRIAPFLYMFSFLFSFQTTFSILFNYYTYFYWYWSYFCLDVFKVFCCRFIVCGKRVLPVSPSDTAVLDVDKTSTIKRAKSAPLVVWNISKILLMIIHHISLRWYAMSCLLWKHRAIAAKEKAQFCLSSIFYFLHRLNLHISCFLFFRSFLLFRI